MRIKVIFLCAYLQTLKKRGDVRILTLRCFYQQFFFRGKTIRIKHYKGVYAFLP